MYNETEEQKISESRLLAEGFQFLNWIPFEPDANNEPTDETVGTMVMVKRSRFGSEYREIEPEGTIR